MVALSLVVALTACDAERPDRNALTGPEASRVVSSVEIEPSGAILEPDGLGQFTAVVKSARGRTVSRNVAWAVADEDVIQIDGSGNVVGLNEGTTTLRATHQGVTGDVSVDVRGEVVSLRLDRESVELAEGAATQLTATYLYANGAERQVATPLEWRSANPAILGVDSDGLTWGAGNGETRIHVRGRGHEVVADGRVLPTTVRRVEVGAPSEKLGVGDEVRFWADVLDDHGNRVFRLIQWSSSNNSVATVSGNGVVTALAHGKATIRAEAESVTGSLEIEVVSGSSQGGSGESARETRPGTVTNLRVVSTSRNSATLRFTEVDDGEGRPAKYEIRYDGAPLGYGWGSAARVRRGSCESPVEGSRIGSTLTCTVEGLQAGTKYDFQLVPYRGTLNQGAVFGPLSDIASGTTDEVPIQVEVLPTGATLEVGQSRQLRASVTDAYGNPVDRSISWSSTRTSVATLSGSGTTVTVRARNVGDTDIRATAGGATGTSKIRVVQPDPPPSSGGSGSASRPNEPSGFARIAEHDFSCLPGDGCAQAGQWGRRTASDHNMSIVTDQGAPQSPGSVFRGRFPRNLTAGVSPFRFDGWGPSIGHAAEYNEIYLSFWIKIDGQTFENEATGTKLWYISYGNTQRNNHSTMLLRGIGRSGALMSSMPLHYYMYEMESDGSDRGGGAQPHLQNVRSSKTFTVGRWHQIEFWMKINDIGRDNGEVKWWLDGTLLAHYNDKRFRSAQNPKKFWHMQFTPVWGGGIGDRSRDDYMLIDHVYISGR